jgi:rhamnosyltransferase
MCPREEEFIRNFLLSEGQKLYKYAVFLAACNGANFLEEQINSILLQEGVSVQLFISVDKSYDGSEDMLSKLALNNQFLTLLSMGHVFGGAAPNFFRLFRDVNLDGFDYISLADQDDIWVQNKLIRAHILMSKSGASAYSSNVLAFWPDGRTKLIKKSYSQKCYDFLFEGPGPGCTFVLSHEFAKHFQKEVISSDKDLSCIEYHDWLIYAFARLNKYKWVIDDWVGMYYRQHSSNQIGANVGFYANLLRIKKIFDGYGFRQAILITNFINLPCEPIIKKVFKSGPSGYLWLAYNFRECRRRPADQIAFLFLCLALSILNLFRRSTKC